MKDIFYDIFCSNYFLVFQTKEANYCWRVVNKRFLAQLPRMVESVVGQMEKEGKTEIALIKIEKL
jgi:uncharacterized protein YhbP (UPF0306 family)